MHWWSGQLSEAARQSISPLLHFTPFLQLSDKSPPGKMNYSMGNWPNFHQIVELQSPFTWLNSKLNQVVYLLYLFPLYYLLPLLLVWMSNWCRSIWQLADPGSDTDNIIVSGHHPWLLVTNSDNGETPTLLTPKPEAVWQPLTSANIWDSVIPFVLVGKCL